MKVLVLTQYYWPESFRITEVVTSLLHAGCDVTVLTGQPNYPDGRVFPGYRAMRATREEHAAGYAIYRVPLVPRGQGKALRLAVNYLSFVASCMTFGRWLLRGQRFDVIFVYGNSPILQAIGGIFLKRPKRAVLVTWVQDLWPQSLEVTGYVRSRRLLAATAVVVRWIYRRSDLLLVQSQAFVSMVLPMAGGTAVKYHPNPGELAFSQPVSAAMPALVLQPGFNVVFAGNLGTVQALGTVLDAADLLREHSDIRIVLVGSGSRGEWLMREVARRNLHNVQFAWRLPPEAMPAVLAQASAMLVSLVRDVAMEQTVPSKVQAYLAAGRPVIASLDGEGARIVEEAGAGLASPAEDAAALATSILRLRTMPETQLQRMGEAGRCYYREHFEPALLALKLKQHFQDALRPIAGN